MRVKLAEKIKDLEEQRRVQHWLKPGKVYAVLEVWVDLAKREAHFRLISEQSKTPALFPVEDFTIVDAEISSGWVFEHGQTYVSLQPKRWSRPGFWEAYFNDDPTARMEFEEVVRELVPVEELDRE